MPRRRTRTVGGKKKTAAMQIGRFLKKFPEK
jgi:hypothetical protein